MVNQKHHIQKHLIEKGPNFFELFEGFIFNIFIQINQLNYILQIKQQNSSPEQLQDYKTNFIEKINLYFSVFFILKSHQQKYFQDLMQVLNPDELSIYRFEQGNIIMIHKQTKILYQYFQTPIIALKQKNVYHNNLLQSLLLPTGLLYKKGITSMQIQTGKRLRMSKKQFYEEQEIVNTFLPILECLQYLHSKDIVHGSVSSHNIVFNQEGDVLLRDWLLQIPNNKYYQTQKIKDRTQADDINALGNIILEAATLNQHKNQAKSSSYQETNLKKIIQKYSRGFILAVYIMLRKIQKFYPHLQKILKNNQSYIDSSEQLVVLYRKIKGEKQFKPVINPTLLNYSNYKYIDLINKTPITTKKIAKIQDVQNKKSYLQDSRKKNIQRVHRIAQKNSNNSQLIKKPDMALKKMSNIKINSGQELQKSFKKQTKQQILKFGSPLKRLRTVSKKKAI